MMNYPMVTPLVLTGVLTLAVTTTAQTKNRSLPETTIPQEKDPIAQYKKYIQRVPFLYHTWGRMVLAKARESETLDLLLRDYRKPISHEEFTRYTVAQLFGRYFDNFAWVDQFAKLREEHDGPGDMWLWINTLALSSDARDSAAVAQFTRTTVDTMHKSAAIAALATRKRRVVIDVIPEVCAALPRKNKPGERRMLIGALSSAILANKDALSDQQMQKSLRAYINLLAAEVGLTRSAMMVIARHLAKTIGKDRRYIEPEPWLRLLDQDYTAPKRTGNTVTQTTFFGIDAEGDRICYLIDMSNSMLKPIDPSLLKKGPVTGPKKKRRKGQLPGEDDIPWHLIKSRFDLAREHLKISIQRLAKDKRFCVVWFGDRSGLLKSTPGMVKASRTNVKRVLKELASINPTARPANMVEADAPHGILKGFTNLHGGMMRAFSMKSKGFTKTHSYVDYKTLAEGCDTIFLISDGAATSDDFDASDRHYGDIRVVSELEYAREVKAVRNVVYQGPMVSAQWLYAELMRLNAFRKVPVHCIGIGEADVRLLRAFAGVSHGEIVLLGAKAKGGGR